MYAVVTRYQVAEPLSEAAEQELVPSVEALMKAPGNRAVYGFEPSPTEKVAITIWETQRDAEAALQQVGESVRAVIGSRLVGAPQRYAGEVESPWKDAR